MQWNCRSLEKNIDHLKQFLAEHRFQIICLQSLNIKQGNLPKLSGYLFPPINDSTNSISKVYTAIYIRVDINYTELPCPIPQSLKDIHACAVKIELNNTPCTIISTYLPKGPKENNTDWLRQLPDTPNSKYIIAGDFNAHSPFWEKNCITNTCNRLVENIVDSKLYLLNDGQITRIPDNINHRPTSIDLTLVSPVFATISKWVPWSDTLNSDHLPLITTIEKNIISLPDSEEDKIIKFNYKEANWDKFTQKLYENHLNSTNYDNKSVDDMYSLFTSTVINAAKESIPQLKGKINPKHTGNIWWNKDCAEAISQKKLAYKKYLKDPSTANLLASKQAKNHANRVINQAKNKYWTDYCNNADDICANMQELWSRVKAMKSGIHHPEYPIKLPNSEFPTQKEKADAFVNTFVCHSTLGGLATKDKDYRLNIESLPVNSPPKINNTENTHSIKDITLNELKREINKLSNKTTSVGLDSISNDLIKHLPPHLIDLLLKIFNKCWIEGEMPSIWKQSVVVPIHKPGKNDTDINSYRPISLTSHVCKLLERIIHNRLSYICNIKNIIPNNQAGFRKGRNTTEHLVKLTTQIKKQFARRKNLLATFFDIRKAFDQVWHHRLIIKLQQFKLDPQFTSFIKNFLQNRSIQVRVGNTYSQSKKLDMGLPQGSVLSPILFSIYIADLPHILSKDTNSTQFADDICIWQKLTLKHNTKKDH